MSDHKYQQGEILIFSPGKLEFPLTRRPCEVTSLLPSRDGQPQYRVRCLGESLERVARESSLSPQDGPQQDSNQQDSSQSA